MNGDLNRSSASSVRVDEYGMLPRLQIAAAIGCGFVLVYAIQFWGTWALIRVAAVGILIAGAALFMGFVLGFIFCIPRTAKPAETSAPSAAGKPDAKDGTDIALRGRALRPRDVETNSNLVDISDWITKILVGVGLVELNKIPGYLYNLSIFLGAGLRADGLAERVPSSEAFALGIVLYFFAAGFLIGYLWTRFYFQTALARMAEYADFMAEYATRVDIAWFDATEAEALLNDNQLQAAMQVVDQALRVNPDNAKALFTKARVLKRLAQLTGKPGDKDLLKKAIEYVSKALKLMQNRAAPLYNLACYQALLGIDKSEILDNLKQAIKLNPPYREEAPRDEDFVSLWEDDEFKEITKAPEAN